MITDRGHPIDGFRQDFDKFHSDFIAAKSLRFRVFAEVWRKHNFSFIMCGRETLAKLNDFMNCLFYQLLDFMQPPHEIETQVCAFYMLYGFYFKQPIKGRVRIRVTNKEWSFILKLEAAMRREAHWDLVYVFHALCSAKAFHFCATRQPFFPLAPVYPFVSDDNLHLSAGKPLSAILGVERLQMLEDIHQRYQLFKQALPVNQQSAADTEESGERNGSGLTSDLNLVRPYYFKNLMEKIMNEDQHFKSTEEEYKSMQDQGSRSKRKARSIERVGDVEGQVEEENSQEESQEDFSDDDGEDDDEEEVVGGSASNSTWVIGEDEHWRTRGRRASAVEAGMKLLDASDSEDEELSGLSIGERRKRLKGGRYGRSPVKKKRVKVTPKHS